MTPTDLPGEGTRPSAQPARLTPETPRTSGEIRFYATRWCGDCRRSKRVFDALGVDYTYVDIEHDAQAERLVLTLNRGMRSVPTIVFPDGSVLTEPSTVELEAKLRALAGA
jgi:mycoredoxin